MAEKILEGDLSAVPYVERQFIVVLPDEAIAAIKDSEQKKLDQAQGNKALRQALEQVSVFTIFAAVWAIVDTVNAINKMRQSGLNVAKVGQTDASRLKFPPGHPRNGFMYVGHPAMPDVYYTVASFHRMVFEHKFSEAVDLLMHLGATSLRVEHSRGWSREFASNMSISLPLKERVEVNAGMTSGSKSAVLLEASFKADRAPCLPDNPVWLQHEPTWQSIAKGRLTFGLTDFSLSVTYDDDFGVNAGLKVSARNAGIELGGRFEDHQSTAWIIQGKFSGNDS